MAGPRALSPNNLPHQLTSFVGREREIVKITRILAGTRLVTLTGAGGCGKTRLAQELGKRLLERFSDGVWWVEIAAISEPGLVPHAIASVLGVPEQSGRPLIEALREALRPKSFLLLLDNCEHLLAACAGLADTLLQSCAHLRIVATSREPLGLTGETRWRVPSLALPDRDPVPSVGRLRQYEAVRLFRERARAIEPTFALTDHNARAVAEVCIRLDGIPLAIELAAARLNVLTVHEIATRLDDRFRLLTDGSQWALPRHQTLRATMDWSYGLLSEAERTLLRRSSAFAGGWTLGAAESICGGDGIEGANVLDLLTKLVDKSLVVAETREGEARYRLLETVRQYGLERLFELGETAGVRTRHLDWYVALAEDAYLELSEYEWECRGSALLRLATEQDNLRGALAWSLEAHPEAGVRLGGALGPFWSASNQFAEGRAWLTKALERTQETFSLARARALRYAALLVHTQGASREAATLAEEGIALARRGGDKKILAGSLSVLGFAHLTMGNYERAAKVLEEARCLYQELGDRVHVADMVRTLAGTAAWRGDYVRASTLAEEAIGLFREVGARWGIAYALSTQGWVRYQQHHYPRAVELLEESVALFRELNATYGKARALNRLARVVRHLKDYEEALRLYKECLILSRDFGITWAILECLLGVASVSTSQGLSERAARLFGAAEVLREGIDYSFPLPDRTENEEALTAVRAALDEATFARAWAEGRTMTPEQAVEYALQSRDGRVRKPKESAATQKGAHAGPLAPREREVASLVARGLTNHDIASFLVITERTAETHVQHILNKLGFTSRAQIAAWAVENGLHTASYR